MKEKMPGASSKRWPGIIFGGDKRWNRLERGQACCLLLASLLFLLYFTLHSKRPQEWVSGCFSSSFTALVFTGSKFTMQATPRLHG